MDLYISYCQEMVHKFNIKIASPIEINTHSDKSIAQSQIVCLSHRPIKLPKEASLELDKRGAEMVQHYFKKTMKKWSYRTAETGLILFCSIEPICYSTSTKFMWAIPVIVTRVPYSFNTFVHVLWSIQQKSMETRVVKVPYFFSINKFSISKLVQTKIMLSLIFTFCFIQ